MLAFVGFWLMVMSLVFIFVVGFLASDIIEAKVAILGWLCVGIFLAMMLTGCYLVG